MLSKLLQVLEKARSTSSNTSYTWGKIEDSYLRRTRHRKGLCSRLWSKQLCHLDRVTDPEHQEKVGFVIQWRQGLVCTELLLLPCLTMDEHKQQTLPGKSVLTSGLDILRNEGLSNSAGKPRTGEVKAQNQESSDWIMQDGDNAYQPQPWTTGNHEGFTSFH